jgi:threonine dehydrogenase-like Zn-dependent dehydrogenase
VREGLVLAHERVGVVEAISPGVSRYGRGDRVIGLDSVPARLARTRGMAADAVLNYRERDVVAEIRRLTGGGGDVAIKALGQRRPSRTRSDSVRPGGLSRDARTE